MWRTLQNAFPLLLLLILRPQITDGLPQKSVFSIIQTRDGYLWLTTFDKSNTKGLTTAPYEVKDGTLWVGTGSLTRHYSKNCRTAHWSTMNKGESK